PRRTCCLKPASSVVISYAPTGKAGTLYPPVSLVIVVRVRPLSVCFTLIVTPGTTAPDASWTMPDIAAEKFCAKTAPVANAMVNKSALGHFEMLIDSLRLLFTMTHLSLRCDLL